VIMLSNVCNNRSLRNRLKADIAELKGANATLRPKLALIQVGNRSDSSSYIQLKEKAAKEVCRRLSASYFFRLSWSHSYLIPICR
jgi:5,10-methylene-tetrahydrofolate dehydrogenase/methenyl tetrahydrofolate cyclohydrolase